MKRNYVISTSIMLITIILFVIGRSTGIFADWVIRILGVLMLIDIPINVYLVCRVARDRQEHMTSDKHNREEVK